MQTRKIEVTESLKRRFWEKVDKGKPDECWEWTATTAGGGYGMLYSNTLQGMLLAHRISWVLHNGPIPEGLHVCHHCDNPPCTNPRHLFVGTRSDNAKDMTVKGRRYVPKGEEAAFSILTRKQVEKVRTLYNNGCCSQHDLAKRFGVSRPTICAIVNNINWHDPKYKLDPDARWATSHGPRPKTWAVSHREAQDIQRIRRQQGLSYQELANVFEVSSTTIQDVIKGEHPACHIND